MLEQLDGTLGGLRLWRWLRGGTWIHPAGRQVVGVGRVSDDWLASQRRMGDQDEDRRIVQETAT